MDLRSDIETGKLTLVEAAELSRMLENWGLRSTAEETGDLVEDFLVPLLQDYAARLGSPAEHLAAVRADLARAVAP